MSRLGDLIKSQRLKYKMTAKQLAKKCGVSEAFVMEVESGKRIPNDIIATRMLKAMGTVDTMMNDLNLETADLPAVEPNVTKIAPGAPAAKTAPRSSPKTAPEEKGEISDAWKDALSGVIKRVPIHEGGLEGPLAGHRMLATEDGRIEGARPEQVFYLKAMDNSMRAYRICKGDILLCVPAAGIESGAIMAFSFRGTGLVRKVRKLEGNRAELSNYDTVPDSRVVDMAEIKSLHRVVRVEFKP
ncbi:MAG: S24 family peptidase [Christensenellales bacterium]|jgi:transcriptional regulator with XRE-family HTH domain